MKLSLTRFSLRKFILQNLRSPDLLRQTPWRMVKFWMRGFTTEHTLLLGLNDENWRDFLQDSWRYRITLETNKHVWPILHDKFLFDNYMKGRLPISEALFCVIEGQFTDCESGYDLERFKTELRRGMRFVIKPVQGGIGRGLMFVTGGEDGVMVNAQTQPFEEFTKMIETLPYHLFFRFVEQHAELARLNATSVNTIRVSAFVDLNGQARLLKPVLRVGSRQSAPLDSFFQGGILVGVDAETGVCGHGLSRDGKGGTKVIREHPETLEGFEGMAVPYWKDIRETILGFHEKHPFFDLVGWDVLVVKEGFCVIEGNHNPGLRLPLMFQNLSHEPEFRAFCERRGLIAAR
jgi:hypothetical protein